MTKLLFQALHRAQRSPSQRYRFDQFMPFLEANNYKIDYSAVISAQDDKHFYAAGNYIKKAGIFTRAAWQRYKEIGKAKTYDLAFVQRESFMTGTSFFEKGISAKIPLIFDFDDAIWQNVISEGNKKLAFLKNPDKIKEIISASTEIWAGNSYLADYALQFNKNVKIVPTTVDTDEYQKPKDFTKNNKQICIGWSGSFSTIPHFEHAIDALKILKEKYGEQITFKVIGDANFKNEELGIIGTPWTRASEIQELSSIDIGIMPLPDDEWTKGKCGLKALVYMSMGIATVVSPVGVNTEIIQHDKNGLWASSTEEWVHQLSRLIEDESLRQTLAAQARISIVEQYSVSAWQNKYHNYFQNLIKK